MRESGTDTKSTIEPEKQAMIPVGSREMQAMGEIRVKDHIPEDLSVADIRALFESNVTTWRELQTFYTCAMMEVETKFRVLDQEMSLQYDRNPIEAIKTRIKAPESLAEKMIRRGFPLNLRSVEENIFDMAGVRVICSFVDDIYMLADCFTTQDDVRVLQTKDYIKNPKPSGYRGLHLVVEVPIFLREEKRMMKVEVQFRTIAMDFWASVEHKLRYKKNLPPQLDGEVGSRLSECSETLFQLDQEMQSIRDHIEEMGRL